MWVLPENSRRCREFWGNVPFEAWTVVFLILSAALICGGIAIMDAALAGGNPEEIKAGSCFLTRSANWQESCRAHGRPCSYSCDYFGKFDELPYELVFQGEGCSEGCNDNCTKKLYNFNCGNECKEKCNASGCTDNVAAAQTKAHGCAGCWLQQPCCVAFKDGKPFDGKDSIRPTQRLGDCDEVKTAWSTSGDNEEGAKRLGIASGVLSGFAFLIPWFCQLTRGCKKLNILQYRPGENSVDRITLANNAQHVGKASYEDECTGDLPAGLEQTPDPASG